MNRRDLIGALARAGISGSLLGVSAASLFGDTITVGGNFGFYFEDGKLKVNAKDVVIDGLSLPKFTWGWIGMGVAQGVLSALGGAIFSAIAGAIFGTGKSTEQLLKEQLVAIAKLIDQKLQEHDLQTYGARVGAFVRLFEEYSNDPTPDRLNYLVNNSADALAQLQALGFIGYRHYMIGSSLRLSVLQEVIKHNNTEGTRANLAGQIDDSVSFHNSMVAEIDRKTDLQTYVRPLLDAVSHMDLPGLARGALLRAIQNGENTITEPILGIAPEAMPRIGDPAANDQAVQRNVDQEIQSIGTLIPVPLAGLEQLEPIQVLHGPSPQMREIDWAALRLRVKNSSTTVGQAMIRLWRCAGSGGLGFAGIIGAAVCEATQRRY